MNFEIIFKRHSFERPTPRASQIIISGFMMVALEKEIVNKKIVRKICNKNVTEQVAKHMVQK